MSIRSLIRRAVLVTLCSTSLGAHAWGPIGHHAVGGVADRLLNDAAKAQVAVLLEGDLDKDGQPSGRTSLEAVASWADEIRPTSANRPLRHFDDIPACGDVPDTAAGWCGANGECASVQIDELGKVLADSSRSQQERNEALKWVVHLVGDIHQPLHAATNLYAGDVVDRKNNDNDRGGNDVAVVLAGSTSHGKELHGVWDTDLVNLSFGRAASSKTFLSPATLDKLATQARALPADVLGGTPQSWAIQSNGLARSVAYHFDGFACAEPVDDTITLDASYQSQAKRLIPKQIVLAGARLANLLNSLLGQ